MINEKNSIPWQISQLQTRFQEWQELTLLNIGKNVPDINIFSWLNNAFLLSFFKILFWVIVIVLTLFLALKISQLLENYLNKTKNKYSKFTSVKENKKEKILSIDEWLKRANFFREKGNYRDGIWCLYMAMLQQLNDQKIILHQDSRTDGEYLTIIQNMPKIHNYQTLLISHQKILFANQEATLNMWEECKIAFEKIKFN